MYREGRNLGIPVSSATSNLYLSLRPERTHTNLIIVGVATTSLIQLRSIKPTASAKVRSEKNPEDPAASKFGVRGGQGSLFQNFGTNVTT
jgi:hypothetical protein